MGKIGDLWVRLGLKSDDYKKGISEAKKQTSSFSSSMGKLKAGALAVWAAIGAAVIKFAQDFVGATNKINDAWAQTMASVKASYHSVLADLSNYKPDFSSFRNFIKGEWNWIKSVFDNAKEAGDAAAEMTKAFDAEFELINSVRLQKAMIQEELNELYIAMRNTTLSPADRKAAAERYKSLLQPLADAEVRVSSNMLDAASKAWQAGAGLSREYSTEEMRDFFANYGVNPTATAEKYGELASVYENRKGDKQNQVIFDILTKLEAANAQMSEVSKVLSRTELAIDRALLEFDEALAMDLEAGLEDVYKELDAIDILEDLDITIPPIDLSALDAAEEKLKQFTAEWEKDQEQIKMLNDALSSAIASSIAGGVETFVGLLTDLDNADASQVLSALMQPFADTAMQLGSMLILQGVAVEAFNTSLASLQGGPAIAAGIALVAIGSAMKAGIKALSKGGGSSASTASTYGGDTGSQSYETYESVITVEVVGKISGSDILIAGSNQQKKWNR